MKAITILIAFIITAGVSKAQNFYTYADTAHYLMKEIEGKKAIYTGKPFSVLLDSLKISPVDWTGHVASKNGFGESMRFYFNYERAFERKHILIIDFANVPPYEVLFPAFFPNAGTGGGHASIDTILNIYKPLIVTDVVTKDYYADPDWEPALKDNTPVETNGAIAVQQEQLRANLNSYINQPFSVLWDALTVKPKTIHARAVEGDDSKEAVTAFFYSTPDQLSRTYFQVTWQTPIPKTITQKYQLSTIRDFTAATEYAIYSDKVIKKLEVFPTIGRWIVISSTYKKVLIDGLYQWRYEVTKKYCDNGVLGSQTEVSYSTTNVPVEYCTTVLEL